MIQQQIDQPLDISFHQKSTGLSLVITTSTTAYYIANMWPMRPIALATDTIPAGFGSLLLSSVLTIIIAQIVLQIVLTIGSGSAPEATAHERRAEQKAQSHAFYVLVVGVLAAVGTIFFDELTVFYTANIAIVSLFFAEIVKLSLQLVYSRK